MRIVHESYLYLILFPVFDGVGLNQNSIFIYYFSIILKAICSIIMGLRLKFFIIKINKINICSTATLTYYFGMFTVYYYLLVTMSQFKLLNLLIFF